MGLLLTRHKLLGSALLPFHVSLFPLRLRSWAGQFLKFPFALGLLWVSVASESSQGRCLVALLLSAPTLLLLRPGKQHTFLLGYTWSLTNARGPFGITLVLQMEKLKFRREACNVQRQTALTESQHQKLLLLCILFLILYLLRGSLAGSGSWREAL